jgi:polysaccharide biosynthesis/export protein
MARICVVLSFTVAILVSSSVLLLRAQTRPAGTAATSVSQPDAVKGPSPSSTSDEFVIGPGDILAINVWKEAEISKVIPVRSDGRISLPLIGELQASGLTPKQLETEITKRLKDYVADPSVTVVVQEVKSQKINVLGMVAHPASYVITNSPTVLDAIALAGGFRDFAKQKSIYVLRQSADGTPSRLPFNYKEVIKGVNPAQNVKLQPGDTVVVP